jgi:hypothetical protein
MFFKNEGGQKMRRSCVLILFLLLALVSNASATYCEWKGVEGGDWFTATNWANGIVPNATGNAAEPFYKAGFKTGAGSVTSPGITAGVNVTTDQVTDGGGGGGRLTIDGGTMAVSQYFFLGVSAAESGILEMKSGSLSTGIYSTNAHIYVGQAGKGTVNMTGGVINVRTNLSLAHAYAANPLTNEGLVNLLGGVINANDLLMNGAAAGKSNLIITNGFLVLNGDKTVKIDGWISSNNIRTTIPGGSVLSAYDPDSMKTTVWAIPEPATICLLGFGALSLIGRKK